MNVKKLYLQKHTAVSVNVGPWVLGLALFQQDVGDDLVQLTDQFEHGVVGEVLERELSLASVPRIRLPEHGVAVTWHNLV